jgi:hypothetical protein
LLIDIVSCGHLEFGLKSTSGGSMGLNRVLAAVTMVVLLGGCSGTPDDEPGAPAAAAVAPSPATAAADVISPADALGVFRTNWAAIRGGAKDALDGGARVFVPGILKSMKGFGTNEVTDVTVGVPAGQTALPAYFVVNAATAVEKDDMTLHFYAMFVRTAEDQPWTVVEFRVAPNARYVPQANVTDGYLAAVPATLAVEPGSLPERYATWFNRSMTSKKVGDHAALTFDGDGGVMHQLKDRSGVNPGPVFYEHAATPGEVRPERVPLRDGSVLVSFSAAVTMDAYNNDKPKAQSCKEGWVSLDVDQRRYRHTEHDAVVFAVAAIPPSGKTLIYDNVITEWAGAAGDPC